MTTSSSPSRVTLPRSSAALLVILAALAIGLMSCHQSSPTGPTISCAQQAGCSAIVASPLSQGEEAARVEQARAEVSIDLGHACTTPAPRVVYTACPFWVPNSTFGNVCAAGMTDTPDDTVHISTFEPGRTGPLVYWEARNYFWCKNNLCQKAI